MSSLIYDSRIRALDSSGNPLVGATLTIYDTGTTTLSSVYRDAALSTPMTNPTSGADLADSGGWFPQIFAAEGASFDITLKTAGGVVVKSYVSVPALGTGASDIKRDFGPERLWIRGAGGIVHFEGGDPTGDNVGGKVRLGGYNGTTADTMSLDAAAITMSGSLATGGIITENSKPLMGAVQDVGTFSAAASVIIPLTNTPSGVRVWEIDLEDFVCATSTATILANLSFDGGVTYDAGAGAYSWSWSRPVGAANTVQVGVNTSDTSISLSDNAHSGMPCLVRLRVNTAPSAGTTKIIGDLVYFGSTAGAPLRNSFQGYRTANLGRASHIKIAPSAGTISGAYRSVPLRGF